MFSNIYNHTGPSRLFLGDTFLQRRRRRKLASLLLGLIAHWKLEEAEGTRFDAAQTNHLNVFGDVMQVEGLVGLYATQFAPGAGYLYIPSNSSFRMGTTDFTIAGWVFFDAVGSAGLVGKWDVGSQEYLVCCDGNHLCFSASPDGANPSTVTAPQNLDSGAWYHFVAWHTLGAGTLNLSINNLTPATLNFSNGVFGGSADLILGTEAATGASLAGRLDSISLWKRLLTPAERTLLYNNGNGLDYPF